MCGWGGSGGKGQRKHAVYCRWVSVREPDCMRVPRQGPHGGGGSTLLHRQRPHETCLLHTRPMWSPGVACGRRSLKDPKDPKILFNI